MDEKKSIKVSLGTVICIFIIILLIVALGVVYYLGFVKNNEKISELENKQIVLEEALDKERTSEKETKTENIKEDIITTNSDYTIVDNNYVVDLINELYEKAEKKGVIHELRVSKIIKDDKNNRYLIVAWKLVPTEITQEEYNKLVQTGNCSDVLYIMGSYVKSNEQYGEGHGYGFVVLHGEDSPSGGSVYEIVKTDTGYAFISPAGPGYPMNTASKEIGFYLTENSKINVYNKGEKALKEYAETLKEKLSGESIPIVTVKYKDGAIMLNELGI